MNFLTARLAAGFIGPVGGGEGAVRAEHHDQPLAGPRRRGQSEARQAHEKRQGGCGEAHALDELSAMNGVHDCSSDV